ncbi:MAG: S-layer homology domain-containing protein [Thermoanaerobaculia bacterium]
MAGALLAGAAPAAAAAGDASATAARASLSGTVLGIPINLLDQELSHVEVSQGDEDQEATETLLEIALPVIGNVPLVSAAVVSSTASSDGVRATGTSFLSDVGVSLGGLGGLPQILGLDAVSSTSLCPILGEPSAEVDPPVTVTLLGQEVDVVLDEDIEVDIGIASAVLRIGHTEVTTDSALAIGLQLALEVNVLGVVTLDLDLTIAETACERGNPAIDVFDPVGLEVDFEVLASDGNDVFEPGETVDVAPQWVNQSGLTTVAQGTASNYTGPAGAAYALSFDFADYGIVEPDDAASCRATGVCYQMGVNDPAVRPARHWDATFSESLTDGSTHVWKLHLGDSFLDVPRSNIFYRFVETIWHHRITSGCTTTEFCPTQSNPRDQMAAFMLKAFEGPGYAPPACVAGQEMFNDVPAGSIFCPWIEELARRGVASGCGGGNYCPAAAVTREQMPPFLLKTLLGSGYTPPACTGIFADVPCPSQFANWIEDLFNRGVAAGCTDSPLQYCPSDPITRAEMSVFITRNFGLVLYGP